MAEDLFKGTPREDIDEFFKTYETTTVYYNLDNLLRLQYLHNLFDGKVKRFYRDQVYENELTYEDSKSKMIDQYNNATTQNLMRQYLQNLNFKSSMEKENCEITAGGNICVTP